MEVILLLGAAIVFAAFGLVMGMIVARRVDRHSTPQEPSGSRQAAPTANARATKRSKRDRPGARPRRR